MDKPELQGHFDVIIVGAGLSGIGAAVHLTRKCPTRRYLILEARHAIGGTWDLFRYPGIRSDSDMYTLGYRFKPWTGREAIADGASIKAYIDETATQYGVDRHIRFGYRVVSLAWSSAEARWTVEVERQGQRLSFTCSFVMMCSGYYSYEQGHRPSWPGEERFAGPVVHPQFWPEHLDFRDKRVVVIGSGATAVTLVPAMAEHAAHVTMLQRSPGYVVSLPSVDVVAEALKRRLPATLAYHLVRLKNVSLSRYFFRRARRRPQAAKNRIITMVRAQLDAGFDVDRHFTPRYNPWDERLCIAPDGDLFKAIRRGRAAVVTGTIATFTESGIRLQSGEEIAADVVVTATGLKLRLAGGAAVTVDGVKADLAGAMSYKGCMLSDVPNFVMVFGYTNASWTLKADLVSDFTCRVLKRMDARGAAYVVARRDPAVAEKPFLDFTSGYVQRNLAVLPRQGDRTPWMLRQDYLRDLLLLQFGAVEDGALEFRKTHQATAPRRQAVA